MSGKLSQLQSSMPNDERFALGEAICGFVRSRVASDPVMNGAYARDFILGWLSHADGRTFKECMDARLKVPATTPANSIEVWEPLTFAVGHTARSGYLNEKCRSEVPHEAILAAIDDACVSFSTPIAHVADVAQSLVKAGHELLCVWDGLRRLHDTGFVELLPVGLREIPREHVEFVPRASMRGYVWGFVRILCRGEVKP